MPKLMPLLLAAFLATGPAPLRAADPAPPKPPLPGVSETKVIGMVGHIVNGQDNAELGRVVDVLVGADGKPVAVVIDVGGFMGVGSRQIAIAWEVLRFAPLGEDKPITIDLPPKRLENAPAYPGSEAVVPILGPEPAAPPAP